MKNIQWSIFLQICDAFELIKITDYNLWGSSTPKPLDSVYFMDESIKYTAYSKKVLRILFLIMITNLLGIDPAPRCIDARLPKTIVSTGKEYEFHVMRQASDKCRCHPFIIQNIHPL